MERLIEVILSSKTTLDREQVSNSKDLYGEGIIDSLDVLIIIDEICAEYEIEIGAADFERSDFKTAESILALVNRHLAMR